MAIVFTSASDETAGADARSMFTHGGWMMSENDWTHYFAPAWEDRVLAGPPRIPYLHMTEIRSEQWRTDHHISRDDAENRVAAAAKVISQMGSLYPVSSSMKASDFHAVVAAPLKKYRGATRSQTAGVRDPDYLCFLAFALVVLKTVHENYPDVEKVKFIIERKNSITKHIQQFYENLPEVLQGLGEGHLMPLLGDLIPAGKERIPLQAADILCWYRQRIDAGTLTNGVDIQHWNQITQDGDRCGHRHEWTRELLEQFTTAIHQRMNDGS